MTISQWSTSASNNATGVTNVNWAEGQAPSTVNGSARQEMADVADWYRNSGEWINRNETPTYVSTTSFKISGSDVTAHYTVGRRVKIVGSLTGTIYGIITASSFSTDTTVTVLLDSGSINNETLTVSIGILTRRKRKAVAVTSSSGTATINLSSADPYEPVFTCTLTENTAFTFSNPDSSGFFSAFLFRLTNSTSGHTPSWSSTVEWDNGTAPTLTTASQKNDLVFWTTDGGTKWAGKVAIGAYST